MASRIKVVTHPRGRLTLGKHSSAADATWPRAVAGDDLAGADAPMVAMGASTGGPRAVLTILQALPATFPLPILLVIHIGRTLGMAMADWLDSNTRLEVRFARDGQPIPPAGSAQVVMAPPDRHLLVDGDRLRTDDGPPRHHCRPAVDVLFESVARRYGNHCVACLLTGMGRDGAAGMEAVSASGGLTLAQDEASSAVFGMPGEAIRRGAARRVLGLDDFAPALVGLADAVSPAEESP